MISAPSTRVETFSEHVFNAFLKLPQALTSCGGAALYRLAHILRAGAGHRQEDAGRLEKKKSKTKSKTKSFVSTDTNKNTATLPLCPHVFHMS